ncbi:PREDICTED: uncharacterized protein LOC106332748 [Brassica oleracea var. oleracea]|uniref:uncharacterized protein LOC106332748 n=1 Tax=Brassica oleracea var. oleracea TaxID=109376 RepID=UPI0006A73349|nr:PREDICTED: uncharacterized protein LOC106332748 [Brassica oleracea var. oleracea]
MRGEHGIEVSKSLAWDAREYAINTMTGIPETGYAKIPKYLHMMKEANHGSHTSYETDKDGIIRFHFISFGQCVRGFYRAIRKVIVLDGTFLKSKIKGVLLVATALDGNSSLYPLAFRVVDSENDRSWDWFMRQLKVVIADDQSLAFVSDRNTSLAKAIANVYPQSHHEICIHNLLNNVVTYYHGKGLVGLVANASKAYRVVDFQKIFTNIFSISHEIGKYLIEADVRKWARCQFPGFRYDIRSNNPAESMNFALRSSREFTVIPLLDIIREMITRWHAVKAGFSVGRPVHSLTDEKYTTSSWISVYEERINLISVPEDAWIVLEHVEKAKFLSPESRRAAGRRKKRRYETVKVKICSQGSKGSTRRKCSSCGIEGHNRSTCDRAI